MLNLIYRAADALRRRSLTGNHGRLGEDLAHRYLRGRGCTVVARNYRPPSGRGEIDLVVRHGEKLVFVEVKTRLSGELNAPERDIDRDKIEALRRAARDYVKRAAADPDRVRFDVVAIAGERVEYFPDAFA